MGAAWEVLAPAKLNLYLEVLGKRDDGFHELETLMVPIRLYDQLQWRRGEGKSPAAFSVRFDPATASKLQAAAPCDRRNLVWQAAELLAQAADIPPVGQITLLKRIPTQAGLGGGSSDAAAALVLTNAAWGLNLPRSELCRLAAQLGSDVPFFLSGGSAVCRGRGEQVEQFPGVPRLNVVVVAPPQGVPTAAAFAGLAASPPSGEARDDSRGRLNALLAELNAGSIAGASRWMSNRLQTVATELCPWVARLGTAFASTSCFTHLLTGSGSAYFGIVRSARHARRIAAQLSSANLGTVFASATCG